MEELENNYGIYLDVDIELLSGLTERLKDKMFCCFMNSFSMKNVMVILRKYSV